MLDTKWQLINGSPDASSKKYGLSQADLYQLFAYGEKYLNGTGVLFLIYPRHTLFPEPLPHFAFTDDLKLWAIPFAMHADLIRWPADCALPFLNQVPNSVAA